MGGIKVIDADSHVFEVEETWDYLPEEYRARRPVPITLKPGEVPYLGINNSFWLVDGRVVNCAWGRGSVQVGSPLTSQLAKMKEFSIGSQSLLDVDARIRDLDNAHVDIQVIYPTLFNVPLSEDEALQTVLMKSYNTWIASRCAERPNRLKWAAVLPLCQPQEAVREIYRAKEAGAVSFWTHGTVGEKMLHAPEFDPVWAAASESGLPVCVHIGWSYPPLRHACDDLMSSLNVSLTLPLLLGFFSFTGGGILDRFRRLRVGFLEGGAGWIPWFLERITHYYPVTNFFRKSFGLDVLTTERPDHYRGRIYTTCEADEVSLPQVIQYLGEDHIMVSEDMPHFEAREGSINALRERTDIQEHVKNKILLDNPRRFYNL